jgi:hypothetical protein
MNPTHGPRASVLLGLPAAAAVRGIALSLARLQPQWIPYYVAYALYNYLAIGQELAGRVRRRRLPRGAAEPA